MCTVLLAFDLIIVLQTISPTEDEEDGPEPQTCINHGNEDTEEDAQRTHPPSKGQSSTTKTSVKSTSNSKNFRPTSGKSTSKCKKKTPDPEEDPGTESESEESALAGSYRTNKENTRVLANSNIMNDKATGKSAFI